MIVTIYFKIGDNLTLDNVNDIKKFVHLNLITITTDRESHFYIPEILKIDIEKI